MSEDDDLTRFVRAQEDDGGTYRRALSELRAGRKTSHWMWFIFPQLAGLGRSATAQHYALSSLAHARAYLAHPVLGPRLLECSTAVAAHAESSAEDIFGAIDAVKLRSSMTLFLRADADQPIFAEILAAFFDNVPDAATDALLSREGRARPRTP